MKQMRNMAANPRPVKFDKVTDAFLNKAAHETGMNVSELIRRSVRLMRRQSQMLRGYGFILDLA